MVNLACEKASRSPDSITVIGVTKTVSPSAIPELVAAGLTHFGENRWQQAKEKVILPDARLARWHFIGHLQSNKVKYIVPYFDYIHSIDSLELAETVNQVCEKTNRRLKCFLQVNVSGELSKTGVKVEDAEKTVLAMQELRNIDTCGLMTMAPNFENPEDTRSVFRRLRELKDDIVQKSGIHLTELSMGMSGDFEVAVEEGATFIRVGRKLMEL